MIEIKKRKESSEKKVEKKENYERKVNEKIEKKRMFYKKEEKKIEFQKEIGEEKMRHFLNNTLNYYAGLELGTNPFEDRENDETMSSLSMWKETYKEIYSTSTL